MNTRPSDPPDEDSGRFIVPPREEPGAFSSHDGWAVWWRSGDGVVHACDGREAGGAVSYSTLCGVEAPAAEIFQPVPAGKINCVACMGEIAARRVKEGALAGRWAPETA